MEPRTGFATLPFTVLVHCSLVGRSLGRSERSDVHRDRLRVFDCPNLINYWTLRVTSQPIRRADAIRVEVLVLTTYG